MGKVMRDNTGLMIEERLRDICNVLETGKAGTVYGFHINGSESDPEAAVTYLKDAVGMTPAKMDYTHGVFDYGGWRDAFFMPRPCMLKYDGTVDYYLDPNNYGKKEDGVTDSDVADTSYGGNAMMEWGQNGKKIWYKIVPDSGDDTSASIYISDYQVDSDFHAWSFINSENSLVDHFYTPCYFGSIVNDGTNDVLRSLSGRAGSTRCKNKTSTVEVQMARRNHTSAIWDIEVYADVILINLLLVLMGKNLNTQKVFGEGLHTSGSDAVNDAFTSGQHDTKGLFYGTNSGAAATYTNAVKVFGMENYWGFMWRRMQGLIANDRVSRHKLTRGTADGSSASDYVVSDTASAYSGYVEGGTLPTASGTYIGQMQFNENEFTPKTAGGTSMDASHYYCDGLWTNTGCQFALRGGASAYGSMVGAWSLSLYLAASFASWHCGAAPSCKPLS